jgi:hypothetical protein
MFILLSTASFVSPETGPQQRKLVVVRTQAIIAVEPLEFPRLNPGSFTKLTVAECGDLIVLEPFTKFLARLWKTIGIKAPLEVDT